jgi:hypothetical protein
VAEPPGVQGRFTRSGEYPIIFDAAGSRFRAVVDDGDLGVLDPDNIRSRFMAGPRAPELGVLIDSILAGFDYLYGEAPRDLTEAYQWANDILPPADAWVLGPAIRGNLGGRGGAKNGYELMVHVERKTVRRPPPAASTRRGRRSWESLSDSYRKRLLGAGRRRGMSEQAVRSYYERGEDPGALSGHATTPRSPAEALRNPDLYPEYIAARGGGDGSDREWIARIVATILNGGGTRLGESAYLFVVRGARNNNANGPENSHA